MFQPPSLPLSLIFPVSVVISPAAVTGLTFNQGLFVGPSTAIPSVGANSRIRQYSSTSAMITDGFLTSSPEYLAATLYFDQVPAPSVVWIGRQDLTAIQTAVPHSGNAGTNYVVGDVVTVVQSGASGGQLTVTTVGSGGVVTGLSIIQGQQGTGYSVATGLTTTGGSGTSLEVDITAIGETPLQAVSQCRIVQSGWYCCMFVGTAVDADHEAIANFLQSATPPSMYFLTSGEAAILNNTSGNLFATLQAASYTRTFMQYATTQGGTYPNNIYASAAVMGRAMGLNTGAAGSYFALMFKQLIGVGPEPLSQTQVANICGTPNRSQAGLNGNVCVNYDNGAYSWIQFGLMASGNWFDEILNLDMIANDMQTSGVNLLVDQPSIPVTDAGVIMMINVLAGAMQRSQQRGFIANAGTWTGGQIGTGAGAISTGASLPSGYTFYAPPVSTLSQAQRSARQLPAITALLVEAGSAVSLSVTIDVEQ